MQDTLLPILLAFAILFLVYWGVGKLGVTGVPQRIIGIACAIIFVIYALNKTGLMPSVRL